ncbi:hypothetical protein [Paracoccus sp. (in: a-proteobacteria)]|uniref:hypothetical protein n=1 Tax=Paracoccus sp. TaxID=267 RepID=UPI0026E07AA8|nr:hypothetical protein [Paracoccus sp. (in: a-proteobacteria)]
MRHRDPPDTDIPRSGTPKHHPRQHVVAIEQPASAGRTKHPSLAKPAHLPGKAAHFAHE